MGSLNHRFYLQKFIPKSPGRILEVGSKDYGNTQDFRSMYGGEYVGLDLEDGKGVDVVHDLTQGLGPLAPESFDLIICCSVLEHVKKPWKMAEHLTRLLKPGADLYIAAPWVWRYHAYPDDYFRYSWRGIQALFEELEWREFWYSDGYDVGKFFSCVPGADNAKSIKQGGHKYLPYLDVHGLGRKR